MSAIDEPPPPTPEQIAAWEAAQAEAEREMAAADAAAASAAAVAAAAPPPGPHPVAAAGGGGRAFWYLLPVLLAVGAGAASALLKPPPEPEPAAEAPKVQPPEPLRPGDLDSLDVLVRAGSYADALNLCRDVPNGVPAERRALAYREGLCWEALGHLKSAAAAFKRAEHADGNVAAWARAVLGQARCACAAGDLHRAEALLDRAFLRSGHPDCARANVAAECLFLRARLLALRAGPVRARDPFDDGAVVWPSLAAPVDRYHEWLSPDAPASPSAGPNGPNELVARRAPTARGGYEVTAHLAERYPAEALRALAGALGVALVLDEPEREALSREAAAVDVRAAALGDVLDALTHRHGVVWALDGKELVVARGAAAVPDRARAAAALERALAAAPKDRPLALAARVWLGNYAALDGRWYEAAGAYRAVLSAGLSDPVGTYAGYNLGLAELRAGSFAFARSRFVELIDRAPRTHWVDYAWWWVGRTYLDAGNVAEARSAFETARGGASGEVSSAALLALAACDLLDGRTDAARARLADRRVAPREDHALLHAALEALFRHRAAPTPSRQKALTDALALCGDGRALGPAGAFLVGGVYRELDLPERCAALYDAAGAAGRGPLVLRMVYDAADWYALADKPAEARERFLAVAVLDPKGLGPRAELRLADLDLAAGRAADCVRRCRALAARPGAPRAEVLALMGRAYEAQKDYRAAAECYSGRVPQ